MSQILHLEKWKPRRHNQGHRSSGAVRQPPYSTTPTPASANETPAADGSRRWARLRSQKQTRQADGRQPDQRQRHSTPDTLKPRKHDNQRSSGAVRFEGTRRRRHRTRAMTASGPILPSRDGQWVDSWLSADRLTTCLKAASGSRRKSLALYEWNIAAACAVQQDLCHLEVGLRNAYDAAIRAYWTGATDWTNHPAVVFPPMPSTRGRRATGNPKAVVDINAKQSALLIRTRTDAGGATAPAGKVIAELSFGFWRYLSIKSHEKSLWVPYLHHAFPAGTGRALDVDRRVHRPHPPQPGRPPRATAQGESARPPGRHHRPRHPDQPRPRRVPHRHDPHTARHRLTPMTDSSNQ